MSDTQLVRELKSVGLLCGVRDGNVVTWLDPVDNELALRVTAAHDKPATDAAVQALKDHVGAASEQWKSYVTARNRRQQTARQELYRTVTDALLFETLENAMVTVNGDNYEVLVPAAAWDNWLAAKAAIRQELPYPISAE